MQAVITILLFALILGTLVLVHELGHFIVARLARVRVSPARRASRLDPVRALRME